ncbi:ShlB/FhaC/HecB family hemolysin secretion/activation protein [Azospirillum sp. ST 5-10]|uniref:ShlB/FhaC/HecB family hemolysin secretion/activation protein n=1 Tax=unclassified Azospirillum TaxID=2630922 RepID=UPI003F4A03C3
MPRDRRRGQRCAAWLLACLAAAGASPPGAVSAQQRLPGSVEPGRLPERLPPRPEPPPPPAIVAPPIPESVPPAQARQITFRLQEVVVDGATVYADGELAALYADTIGKVVSLAVVYRIADTITARYRSDGYILSRAVVPAQRIADGIVHIRVVEGFVDSVTVQGKDDPTIRAYAEPIARSRPLTAGVLERALLLINDLPGVRARAVLTPAAGVLGGSDLAIITSHTPVDAALDVDNRGSEFVGRLQLFARAALNDVSGRSDRIEARIVTTPLEGNELRYLDGSYTLPVGAAGTRVSLFFSANESRPGGSLNTDVLRTETRGTAVTARVSHPLVRSRRETLTVDASFEVRNALVDQYALPSRTRLVSSYEDRIRAIRAGVSYDLTDAWNGTNLVRVELSRGLPILGASDDGADIDTSRPGGRTAFTKLTVDAFRLQELDGLADGLRLLAAASAGWAFGDQLLASEQFGVGGSPFGRGYDPSELTGDYGAAAKIELQYDFRIGAGPGWPSLQAYGFYDFGVVADEDPEALNQSDGTRSLASAGLGIRSRITDWLHANLELAKPLTRGVSANADSSDAKAARLYFGLSARM